MMKLIRGQKMLVSKIRRKLSDFFHNVSLNAVAIRRARYETLRHEKQVMDLKAIGGHGYKVYSQSDEDGLLAHLFGLIGTAGKTFVEFGVGDGLENNTAALLCSGWSGLWIEGSQRYCAKISAGMAGLIRDGHLKLINACAHPENIDELISSVFHGEIDLLSIDIDGNDAHVLERIECVSPRVVVVEYNAKFGPSINYCMSYSRDHEWKRTDNFGASLKYFESLMQKRGYGLVGCNLVGTNAFFVRNDLLGDHFLAPFTSERHFEPARYELVGLPSGHPPSYETFQSVA